MDEIKVAWSSLWIMMSIDAEKQIVKGKPLYPSSYLAVDAQGPGIGRREDLENA